MIASMLDVKKRVWFKIENNQQRREPNWAIVKKKLMQKPLLKTGIVFEKILYCFSAIACYILIWQMYTKKAILVMWKNAFCA